MAIIIVGVFVYISFVYLIYLFLSCFVFLGFHGEYDRFKYNYLEGYYQFNTSYEVLKKIFDKSVSTREFLNVKYATRILTLREYYKRIEQEKGIGA